ncbi:MAG TPA: outer membrane protein assembly factor BamD [Pelagibacteraceae bacterium]|jgi:outer membrane protein assembly factor BamD|nr:outer membrane protein assembly factor BamD [Pelagibacteraceae bacterium]
MFKSFLILLLSIFLLFACSKKNTKEIIYQPTEEEVVVALYAEAVTALKRGEAYYAGKKFKEVESLLPQSEWAAKASLMAGYADYSRNAYSDSIFSLERHINNYPADNNIPYAHYLIAICYYEQILDEKKDLEPLLRAKKKFEFIILNYSDTDYATDARFKIDLIIDQLAAKEMSIARFYMKTEKWIPALNRLKIVVEKYDRTIFVEEALHRLVEVYYKIGLVEEATQAAAILGYNYQSGQWYERSYKIFNKKYKTKKIKKKKEMGLLRKKIKSLFE